MCEEPAGKRPFESHLGGWMDGGHGQNEPWYSLRRERREKGDRCVSQNPMLTIHSLAGSLCPEANIQGQSSTEQRGRKNLLSTLSSRFSLTYSLALSLSFSFSIYLFTLLFTPSHTLSLSLSSTTALIPLLHCIDTSLSPTSNYSPPHLPL